MGFAKPSHLDTYWSEFQVGESDLEVIYNLLLEREAPLTSAEMAISLVEHRLEDLKQKAEEAKALEHTTYLPANEYAVGETLMFPALEGMLGSVLEVRGGENPDLEPFSVIKVAFEDDERREFAAGLEDHYLNERAKIESSQEQFETPEAVMASFGSSIVERLDSKLATLDEIVQIAGRWFPKTLLVDMHEGHLNLAEAVLDVAGGGPLPTSAFLEHIEVPPRIDPLLAAFSLDFALQEDERFDEVGPAGKVLWFLKKLEPPEVLKPPPRLEYLSISYDRGLLSEPLLELERSLDDELGESGLPTTPETEVTLSLLFPHWWVGALPLSARLRPLFPTAYEAPRIRFILVDGHSGDKFPGWVVRTKGYVFGVDSAL